MMKKLKSSSILITVTLFVSLITIYRMEPDIFELDFNFRKDAKLHFKDERGQIIASIDAELAETRMQHMVGLMMRHSMENNQGMLFIMEEEAIQSFWMFSTYIPLDIIFLDENLKINSIHDGQPQSIEAVESTLPSRYVLEVNQGFCQQHQIIPGYFIEFERVL